MKYLPRAAPAPTANDLEVGPPTTMLPATFNVNRQIKARNKARSRAPRSRGFHPSELFGMCPVKYYYYDSSIENLASPDPEVIKSALANAGQDLDVDVNRLVVADARADDGPLLGGRYRWRPRAMGRVYPIRKRTSHLSIILAEGEEAVQKVRRESAAAAGKPAAMADKPEPEADTEAEASVVDTVKE
jgi:hypothetical protein